MTLTKRLAEFALDLKLESLPPIVVETAHVRALDTIGVALAGLPEPCTRIAYETVQEAGQTGSAALFGSRFRTSPSQAALANGIAAHALEYDDVTLSIVSHTSATILPATLSLADHINATGKQFLEAYIVGFELTTRIGWSMEFNLLKHGWHPNGILAVIGGAAAASRLLGANLQQTRAAMGIAASCASGLRKNVGYMTKPFHMGHAAADAVLAAQLARKGYEADLDILERGAPPEQNKSHAYFSFPEVFVGEGDYDLSQIDRNLGTEYELASDSTVTRFHPGSTYPQPAIDEVIDLVTQHNIAPETIEAIKIGVGPRSVSIASYKLPKTVYDARFSLRYAIANAAIGREVTLRQYTQENVDRADIQAMIGRIEVYVPPEFANLSAQWTGDKIPTPVSCKVEIRLKNGKSIEAVRHTTKGYPGARVVWADVMKKYDECASISLPKDRIEKSAGLIRKVTSLESIRDLTKALEAK